MNWRNDCVNWLKTNLYAQCNNNGLAATWQDRAREWKWKRLARNNSTLRSEFDSFQWHTNKHSFIWLPFGFCMFASFRWSTASLIDFSNGWGCLVICFFFRLYFFSSIFFFFPHSIFLVVFVHCVVLYTYSVCFSHRSIEIHVITKESLINTEHHAE